MCIKNVLLVQLVLMLVLCTNVSTTRINITLLTRPLVWSNLLFDIHIPQILHAGLLVCTSVSDCRIYELNSHGTVNPYQSKSESEVLQQFANLPQFVVKHNTQVIEVPGSEENFWKNIKSAVGKISYVYSPLDRNCFAFTEDVLAFFNVTTRGQYASRSRQAFDLDLSPLDIEKKVTELVALDLGNNPQENEYTKARLYFKTNQRTRKGNLLAYIDPDIKLSAILVKLAAYVSHKAVEDIQSLLADVDTENELFQNLSVSLRDVSEDEEQLKQLDFRVNDLYKKGVKAKSIVALTTQAKPPANGEFAGVITFTALSSMVWTEILREKLFSTIFQTFGYDLAAVTLGNLHWYHETKCSTLSNQLLASACEMNSRFILFFGQLTEHQAWVIPLIMLIVSEMCFWMGVYWMFTFEIIAIAIFDWRAAVGFMLGTAIIYAQHSKNKFLRSPLIVGHVLVLFQLYLALVMFATFYWQFSQTPENSRKIHQAASLLKEFNLLLPECTQQQAAIIRPIVVPLRLFLISFPVFDWKVKTVFFSVLIPSLIFEFCTMHQESQPFKWSELSRLQYFCKVLSQKRVQRWLLIAVIAVSLDGFFPMNELTNILFTLVFAIAIWKSALRYTHQNERTE